MSATMHRILIIGGTSGIGEAFARRFHSMGKKVIITGRRRNRLLELQEALQDVDVYAMDIADLAAIPGHLEKLFSSFPDIDTVWVNAGIQYSSDIKDASTSTDTRVIEEVTTNVTAPVILARHIIPRLMQQNNETIFMITSSGLGYVPVGSLFPIYCPTKAFIHDYLVGIRQALKNTNVNVLEIVPPYVGGTELGAEHVSKLKGLIPMPMEEFTDEIFKLLDSSAAIDLKEVAAGSAVPRVEAWRSSIVALVVDV
ncbi:hypothetical protein LTR37_016960 [Vermiconidia calcicola]|uniref:Uncharacterized protein n=1 Tax=Vermiconidia calcicola TaxID=1690605 RepID=A0ACC3MLA0_9PEZI|nr:hypothetical protein LTR37_016960 [Vermiconidia calcicola]